MPHSRHTEIERKFLVADASWRGQGTGIRYRQGYLAASPGTTVRVRVGGGMGMLAIKGAPGPSGLARAEYEFPIPEDQANAIIDELCDGRVVDKTRYRIDYAGAVWEVDEFHGPHEGLVVAEIELETEDQRVELPPWVGEEVTGEYRYTNAWLASHQHEGR